MLKSLRRFVLSRRRLVAISLIGLDFHGGAWIMSAGASSAFPRTIPGLAKVML